MHGKAMHEMEMSNLLVLTRSDDLTLAGSLFWIGLAGVALAANRGELQWVFLFGP